MGLGISHRGGPVSAAVVQEVLNYFEGRVKSLGAREGQDWRNHPDGLTYWRVEGPPSKFDLESVERLKAWERMGPDLDVQELRRDWELAPPKQKPDLERRIKQIQMVQARPKLLIPPDFQPVMKRGIIANLDPHVESLSIVFTQDGTKDEWRDHGDYTKTSHIYPFPGAHVVICEILQNVQWIV